METAEGKAGATVGRPLIRAPSPRPGLGLWLPGAVGVSLVSQDTGGSAGFGKQGLVLLPHCLLSQRPSSRPRYTSGLLLSRARLPGASGSAITSCLQPPSTGRAASEDRRLSLRCPRWP